MKYALIVLLCVLTFGCCKDKCQDPSNPDCENYNPCYGKKPVTAEIIIEQGNPLASDQSKTWLADDSSIYIYGSLRFRCANPDFTCTWKLGAQTINEKAPYRVFDAEGTYSVTLIVEGTPNTNCFPNDDGRDTITKLFKVICPDQALICKPLKGVFNDAPNDSTVIQIIYGDYANKKPASPCPPDITKAIGPVWTNFNSTQDTVWGCPTETVMYNTRVIFAGENYSVGVGECIGGSIVINRKDLTVRGEYQMHNRRRIFTGRVLQ